MSRSSRSRVALLAIAVGLVLADSSVVTLGLPDVLEDFDATPTGVSWVLTAYNLALALVAVPAALLVPRHGAARLAAAGLAVFAVASLACALAPSLGVLIAARVVQGAGGAVVAVAALVLLSEAVGSRRRGAVVWAAAGAIGAAVGPAAGGLLTEALAWEAIFAVQVPIALVCLLAARPTGGQTLHEGSDPGSAERRPAALALIALACLGAGLTAALFLLVLLLIAGWRETPIAAALAVSVMPVAALLAGRFSGRLDEGVRAVAGTVLVAGGLAALGLLPRADIAWTIVPQILIGLGLGLALAALTEAALLGRRPQALHGGWTIAARHAGVVLALALLTPVFTADLEEQAQRTQETALAELIDAPLATTTKLDLGLELADKLQAEPSRAPDLGGAFGSVRADATPEERAALDDAERHVSEQLDRASTSAFERSFLIAAALTALGLVPLLLAAGVRRRPILTAAAGAALAAVVLVCVHVAAGGGSYDVARPPDPCAPRPATARDGTLAAVERLGLTALGSAACDLGVSRERLILSVARDRRLPGGIGEEQATQAFRAGVDEAIDAEQQAGRLPAGQALLLRQAAQFLPAEQLLRAILSGSVGG